MSSSEHLFIPGRTPLLSLHELHAMLPEAHIKNLGSCFLLSGAPTFSPSELISELGGIVKIARVVERTPSVSADILLPHLAGDRITFGISWYTDSSVSPVSLLHNLKDRLAEAGITSRYVAGHGSEPLSSVVISKEHVTELVIVGSEGDYIVGKTEAVQKFEEWGKRDRGRRFADAKAGMLPVKVSRMIVNIALGAEAQGKTLYDPFCGMGTVVAEAYLRGATAIGSDLSQEAVEKAQYNLRDLVRTSPQKALEHPKVFVADAAHVSENLKQDSIDAIATEPYMGPTSFGESRNAAIITSEKVKNTLKGLGKLYVGALKEWKAIVKPGANVVIAIPTYVFQEREYSVKNLIDSCENLGYTRVAGPIEYSRPQAKVKRSFYILRLAENKK